MTDPKLSTLRRAFSRINWKEDVNGVLSGEYEDNMSFVLFIFTTESGSRLECVEPFKHSIDAETALEAMKSFMAYCRRVSHGIHWFLADNSK